VNLVLFALALRVGPHASLAPGWRQRAVATPIADVVRIKMLVGERHAEIRPRRMGRTAGSRKEDSDDDRNRTVSNKSQHDP